MMGGRPNDQKGTMSMKIDEHPCVSLSHGWAYPTLHAFLCFLLPSSAGRVCEAMQHSKRKSPCYGMIAARHAFSCHISSLSDSECNYAATSYLYVDPRSMLVCGFQGISCLLICRAENYFQSTEPPIKDLYHAACTFMWSGLLL